MRNIEPNTKASFLNSLEAINKQEWQKLVLADNSYIFITFDLIKTELLDKLRGKNDKFSDVIEGEIQRGISPDYAKAFIVELEESKKENLENEALKPVVLGKHIQRYNCVESKELIIYLTKKDDVDRFPNIKKHIQSYNHFITCKEVAEGKHPWYSLHRARNPEIFLGKKFIGLTTSKTICVAIDDKDYYATDALYLFKKRKEILIKEEFILGVIHSKLFGYLYDLSTQGGQRVIPQIKAVNLYDLPFPMLNMSDKQQKQLHDEMVKLVDTMLSLNKEKQQTMLQEKLEALQHRIQYTDAKINQLVYRLYGLTEAEIALIETA